MFGFVRSRKRARWSYRQRKMAVPAAVPGRLADPRADLAGERRSLVTPGDRRAARIPHHASDGRRITQGIAVAPRA